MPSTYKATSYIKDILEIGVRISNLNYIGLLFYIEKGCLCELVFLVSVDDVICSIIRL